MSPAIRTFGLGAAGKAGKAFRSVVRGAGPDWARGVGREYEDVVVVTVGRVAGVLVHVGILADEERLLVEEEKEANGGNGLDDDDDEERLPVRPTAEREDCAVEDFRRRTRLPPAPVVVEDMPGRIPLGPGRAG